LTHISSLFPEMSKYGVWTSELEHLGAEENSDKVASDNLAFILATVMSCMSLEQIISSL
jgi:hypothetical protein